MKDPAFLFYSSDFLTGCLDLTMEERGEYITLLCLQHQKGHLSEKTIRLSVGNVSVDVLSKFIIDENKCYYNVRLDEEVAKRLAFTESRRNNGTKGGRPKKGKIKPSAKPLGLPSENLIEDENENRNKKVNPSFLEIEAYGKEKGYNIPVQKIIDHYTNGGDLNYWIDAKNKKVIRWKSKISSVWFKDEYKIIEKKLSLIDFKIPNADLYGWGDKKCLEMALKGEYPRK